ncbi:unnamed protein product [Amoebophrya sp. A25]|nr:unnamed protein product [Amoebophrya sp. A25]|eukprot:GSA25T00004821001.1
MKFLNGGDLSFFDLEKLMFEGGLKKSGAGQKRRRVDPKILQPPPAAAPPSSSSRGGFPYGPGPAPLPGGPPHHGHQQNQHRQLFSTGDRSATGGSSRSKFELTAVVSNVPKHAQMEDLFQFFNDKCGRVVDIKFVPGNLTIACVQFAEQKAMDKAVSGLGNPVIAGSEVKIRPSLEIKEEMAHRPKRQVFGEQGGGEKSRMCRVTGFANLQQVNKEDIHRMFVKYGDIEQIITRLDGMEVVYRTGANASQAVQAMNGFIFRGDELKVSQNDIVPIARPQDLPQGMRGT